MTWLLCGFAYVLVMLIAYSLAVISDERKFPTPKPPYRGRL
jgi:hypothetical protein